jgi:hypothetical protein
VTSKHERREPVDPWRGRQPRYEKLVYRGPKQFAMATKLPSGKPIFVQLGPLR